MAQYGLISPAALAPLPVLFLPRINPAAAAANCPDLVLVLSSLAPPAPVCPRQRSCSSAISLSNLDWAAPSSSNRSVSFLLILSTVVMGLPVAVAVTVSGIELVGGLLEAAMVAAAAPEAGRETLAAREMVAGPSIRTESGVDDDEDRFPVEETML